MKSMKSGKARTIAQNDDEYVADTQRDQREAGLGRNLRSDKDWQKPLKKPQGRNHKNGYTRGGGQLPQHWFDMPEAIRQDCLMTVFQGFVQLAAILAACTEPCFQYWAMISGGCFPNKDLIANDIPEFTSTLFTMAEECTKKISETYENTWGRVKKEIDTMKAEGWTHKAVMGRCFAYMFKVGQNFGLSRYANYTSLRDGSLKQLERADNSVFMEDDEQMATLRIKANLGANAKGANFLGNLLGGAGSPHLQLEDGAASPSFSASVSSTAKSSGKLDATVILKAVADTTMRKAVGEVNMDDKTKAKVIRELRATALILEQGDLQNAYTKEEEPKGGATGEKHTTPAGKKMEKQATPAASKAESVAKPTSKKPTKDDSKSTVVFEQGVGEGTAPEKQVLPKTISVDSLMLMSPGSRAVHLELKQVELLKKLDDREKQRSGPPPKKRDELEEVFGTTTYEQQFAGVTVKQEPGEEEAAGAGEEPEVAGQAVPLTKTQKQKLAAERKEQEKKMKEQDKLDKLREKEQAKLQKEREKMIKKAAKQAAKAAAKTAAKKNTNQKAAEDEESQNGDSEGFGVFADGQSDDNGERVKPIVTRSASKREAMMNTLGGRQTLVQGHQHHQNHQATGASSSSHHHQLAPGGSTTSATNAGFQAFMTLISSDLGAGCGGPKTVVGGAQVNMNPGTVGVIEHQKNMGGDKTDAEEVFFGADDCKHVRDEEGNWCEDLGDFCMERVHQQIEEMQDRDESWEPDAKRKKTEEDPYFEMDAASDEENEDDIIIQPK